MPKLKLSIQCDAPDGTTGSFASTLDDDLVSPVFPDCGKVFDWAKAEGYVFDGHDPEYPVGSFSKPDANFITCSTFGGGWIVSSSAAATLEITRWLGDEPVPLMPIGGETGWIVEPYQAGELVQYLRDDASLVVTIDA